MKKLYLKNKLLMLLLLICCSSVFAQRDRDFWFAVPKISHLYSWSVHLDAPVYLRITAYDQSATVTISAPAPGSTFPTQVVNVSAGSTVTVDLSTYLINLCDSPADAILDRGLHIVATEAISVYYELACPENGNIWPLKGKNALGKDFFIPSQNYLANWSGVTSTNSFDIVATEDNTTVYIKPKQNIVGHSATMIFPVLLMKGQTYSAKDLSQAANQQLDGSSVNADKPIAITVTDDMMDAASNWGGTTAYDAGGDQIIPITKIGRDYVAVRGGLTDSAEKLFVLTTQPITKITRDNWVHDTTIVGMGTTLQYNLDTTQISTYIQADQDIYLSQMSGMISEPGWNLLPPVSCNGSTSVAYVRTPVTSDAGGYFLLSTNGGDLTFSYSLNGGAPISGLPGTAVFTAVPGAPSGTNWKAARLKVDTNILHMGDAIIVKNPVPFTMGVVTGKLKPGSGFNATGLFGSFSNFGSLDIAPRSTGPICLGDTLKFFADSLKGGVYSWTGPNGFSSMEQNPFIYPFKIADTGMYILTVKDSNCVSVDSVHVGLSPNCCVKPTAHIDFSDTSFCVGSKFYLNLSGGPYGQFTVDGDTSPIAPIDSFANMLITLTDTDVGTHHLVFVVYSAYPDSGTIPCTDTATADPTIKRCNCKGYAPTMMSQQTGPMTYQFWSTGFPTPNFLEWYYDNTQVMQTTGTDTFTYTFTKGGIQDICMTAAYITPKGNGTSLCCYETVCDSVAIDICNVMRETDSVGYTLDSTDYHVAHFTFYGTAPTSITWIFDNGDTIVNNGAPVTERLDDGWHLACAYIVWSLKDSANCCCVDTICLKADISPCSLATFNIVEEDSANGIYTFIPSYAGGSYGSYIINIDKTTWSVSSATSGYTRTGTILSDTVPSSGYYTICLDEIYSVRWMGGKVPCEFKVCETIWMNAGEKMGSFKSYPNPTGGKFLVEITSYDEAATAKIEVIDLMGHLVAERPVTDIHKGLTNVYMNISNLPRGFYQLRMIMGNTIQVDKLIKQ
ncbi:MAG: hypothetical protein JWO06_186 [Bacteroidota bacterium]|nr:hypothetical protein [Bacteroidota bacterium]